MLQWLDKIFQTFFITVEYSDECTQTPHSTRRHMQRRKHGSPVKHESVKNKVQSVESNSRLRGLERVERSLESGDTVLTHQAIKHMELHDFIQMFSKQPGNDNKATGLSKLEGTRLRHVKRLLRLENRLQEILNRIDQLHCDQLRQPIRKHVHSQATQYSVSQIKSRWNIQNRHAEQELRMKEKMQRLQVKINETRNISQVKSGNEQNNYKLAEVETDFYPVCFRMEPHCDCHCSCTRRKMVSGKNHYLKADKIDMSALHQKYLINHDDLSNCNKNLFHKVDQAISIVSFRNIQVRNNLKTRKDSQDMIRNVKLQTSQQAEVRKELHKNLLTPSSQTILKKIKKLQHDRAFTGTKIARLIQQPKIINPTVEPDEEKFKNESNARKCKTRSRSKVLDQLLQANERTKKKTSRPEFVTIVSTREKERMRTDDSMSSVGSAGEVAGRPIRPVIFKDIEVFERKKLGVGRPGMGAVPSPSNGPRPPHTLH